MWTNEKQNVKWNKEETNNNNNAHTHTQQIRMADREERGGREVDRQKERKKLIQYIS